MITGDNTLTGSNISYKCSISDKKKGLIIVDFVNKKLIEENFIFHDYDNTKDFPADKPLAESFIEDDNFPDDKAIAESFIEYDNFPDDKPIAESFIEDDIRKSSMSKD